MENRVILFTVEPTPEVRVLVWPVTTVEVGHETFTDTGAGDTNGFYDYLRVASGRIIGLRFTPFVEHANLCASVMPGPRLQVTGSPPMQSLEFFWGAEREYDHSLSADQFMDMNYVLRSPLNVTAITFGFVHLEEIEIAQLMSDFQKTA